jgi:hypothetical protein
MAEFNELITRKEELALERDLCAEFYNLIMTRAKQCDEDDPMYDKHMNLLVNMEYFAENTKEEMRKINRQVCDHLGVESIAQTDYDRACEWRYGFGKPNG